MRLNDLAERMGISAPTASRAVEALVALGLVDRMPDPDDRRALRLGLTATGQARASERETRVATAFAPALASLSAAEREQLVGLLSRLSPLTSIRNAHPAVCLRVDSRRWASASESLPLHTSAFSSFSVWSTADARGYGSGHRLRGSVGWPPSSRLIRWSSW